MAASLTTVSVLLSLMLFLVGALRVPVPRLPTSSSSLRMALTKSEKEQTARDLTGYSLWVQFDGFGVDNSFFSMELEPKFAVKFSRGMSAHTPGFWRVVRYDDGRECVECTHPVPPEYMYFFDLDETSILWRGELDAATGRVTKGECLTNKKRFGVLPYSVTLATWEAELLAPGEALPDVVLPRLSEQLFDPPDDFVSPLDMERYPQYFSETFRRWFFAVEEALAKGVDPPERPAPFFVAGPRGRGGGQGGDEAGGEAEVSGKSLSVRERGGKKGPSKGF